MSDNRNFSLPAEFGMGFSREDLCKPEFVPKPSPYQEIEHRTQGLTPAEQALLDEMAGDFRGSRTVGEIQPQLQLPRMGRAAFRPLPQPNEGFVAAKGSLGPSAGSESVRRLHNERWRLMAGEGSGYTRVDLNNISFLIGHKAIKGGEEAEILQAFPEGYSNFVDVLREYRILREIYEPLGIRAPLALALMRRQQDLPWSSREEAKHYLGEKLRAQLPHGQGGKVLREGPAYHPHENLDSGLLFRLFKAAIRPQDYYDMAIAGDWERLRKAQSTLSEFPSSLPRQLGTIAGKLVEPDSQNPHPNW